MKKLNLWLIKFNFCYLTLEKVGKYLGKVWVNVVVIFSKIGYGFYKGVSENENSSYLC